MIRIKPRNITHRSQALPPPAQPGFRVDVQDMVEDSALLRTWVSRTSHQAISDWVKSSLQKHPVPEVGGMLAGIRQELENGWEIFITHFLPAGEVNFQSPVRIDFGSQILLDWDHLREANPGLQLVGWFHTHPGLTPYLSWTDLYTHEGFFTHPSQVAIVLDPLTDNWDTGYFSWKRSGSMNNKTDLSRYFSWNSITT